MRLRKVSEFMFIIVQSQQLKQHWSQSICIDHFTNVISCLTYIGLLIYYGISYQPWEMPPKQTRGNNYKYYTYSLSNSCNFFLLFILFNVFWQLLLFFNNSSSMEKKWLFWCLVESICCHALTSLNMLHRIHILVECNLHWPMTFYFLDFEDTH